MDRLWLAVHITANPRFLRNYLMQANGAEMLRISCCELIERGIRVCAPVHDAILIEAKAEDLRDAVTRSQAVMARVSAAVAAILETTPGERRRIGMVP